MALGKVTWLGDRLIAKAVEVTKKAADETLQASVDDAKAHHWWANRTGDLEANTISTPAHFEGNVVKGKFGSSMRAEGFYGLFLERKTPWLRPAADRHFPEFKLRLGAIWRSL